MKNQENLKAIDDTPEEYNKYFKVLNKLDSSMTRWRAKIGVKLTEAKGGRVLSIGIGNFGEAIELKRAGFETVLCDISSEAVLSAKQDGFEAFECDITKEIPEGKYDYIFCFEVLEHLANPLAAIENLKKSLNENGSLVVSLPNEFNIMARLQILFGKPPFGGHDWHHLRFFNQKYGEKMFAAAKLRVVKTAYTPRIPLWNRFSQYAGKILMNLIPNLFSYSTIWLLKRID